MGNGVSIQWLGDISLNGPFCDPQNAVALEQNLRSVAAALGPCDLRIANWESPLWGDGRVNEAKVPRLATLADTAKAAEPLNLSVVLLANNHAYDCLESGFQNSVTLFQKMGARTVGAGTTREEAARPLILNLKGLRVGLLNYVGYDTHPCLPDSAGVFLNWFDEKRARGEISTLNEQVDAVLVHIHWGRDEFIRMPTVEQRRIARELIGAGARVVVGGHAHVFQGHERWRAGYIFHGTGNFLFWPPETPQACEGQWPRYVREVAVTCCRLSGVGVHDVEIRHLIQNGVQLQWDETGRRQRADRRLCLALRLSDHWFARLREFEASWIRRVRFAPYMMRQAGGLWPWTTAKIRRVLHKISNLRISG
jgi:Bacterial capsule synthesis protein PGA_cap